MDTTFLAAPPLPIGSPGIGPVPSTSGRAGESKKVGVEFEAVFARFLLEKAMPEDGGGLFGSGREAGFARGLFVDSVGDSIARRRALGIADVVEKALDIAQGPPAGTAGKGSRTVKA